MSFDPKYTPAEKNIEAFEYEGRSFEWPILDSDGNAIDLTGKTIRIEVYTAIGNALTSIFHYVTPTNIAIDVNNITIAFQSSDLSTAQTMFYSIWNDTDAVVLVTGKFDVMPMVHSN